MYYSKCPKCGSTNLISYGQWDIVTDHECEDCGWTKCYGSVGGFPGSQYLAPYDSDDYVGGDDVALTVDEDDEHIDDLPDDEVVFQAKEWLNYEENDDLPF